MKENIFIKTINKKGFTMVEVIIAIVALTVLLGIVLPTILNYNEKVHQDTDESNMNDVAHSIEKALIDNQLYSDLADNAFDGNVSCYIDSISEYDVPNYKIISDYARNNSENDQYSYNDAARQDDEIAYNAAGCMYGLTITFKPDHGKYIVKDGIINQFLTKDGTPRGADLATDRNVKFNIDKHEKISYEIKTLENSLVYSKILSDVGDIVEISSRAYRNSDYTIFIKLSGGSKVYGQFNGTHLKHISSPIIATVPENTEDATATTKNDKLIDSIMDNTIPENGIYYTNVKTNKMLPNGRYTFDNVYKAGDEFPIPKKGDIYRINGYELRYGKKYDENHTWKNADNEYQWYITTIHKSNTSYLEIPQTVGMVWVENLDATFKECKNMTISPDIPCFIKSINNTFEGCEKLEKKPALPEEASGENIFKGCTSLDEQ